MKLLIIAYVLIQTSFQESKLVINKEYGIDNPKGMSVMVDNINGDVSIEPSADGRLHMQLEIFITAQNDELINQAEKELELGQQLGGDTMIFFTKAPFIKKCKWENGWGYTMENQPQYRFKYQYKLRVPREVSVYAKTVNQGDIYVANIDGLIKASNVNGSVEVKNARKLQWASAVNRDITINFLEAPVEPLSFNNVNGDFHFELPADFNAQVYFDSMNGDLYTSFDYRELPPKVSRSTGKGKFKINSKNGVEIGLGGPELTFKTINGNVYLKKS